MSIVLWATTVGSVAGPNLSEPGSMLGAALGMNPLSGPYLFSVAAFVLAALVVLTLRMGAPGGAPESSRDPAAAAGPAASPSPAPPRAMGPIAALRVAARNPNALFALVAIVTGQMMMTSVMVMTPVSMNHDGMALDIIGLVISVHVVGMYAASPVFGWLADRIGPRLVAILGACLFVVAFALGAFDAMAPHTDMVRITIALGVLGLGWSAAIIGGSTLLTQSVETRIKVPLQGSVDSLMNFGAAALAALAGPVLAFGGFLAVNVMAACVLAPLVFFAVRAFRWTRSERSAGRVAERAA
jgi:predicted MFS family arabinose efflux permease